MVDSFIGVISFNPHKYLNSVHFEHEETDSTEAK